MKTFNHRDTEIQRYMTNNQIVAGCLSFVIRNLSFVIFFVPLCLCVSVFKVSAQDPQFSQFYASPLYLGPSMAGAAGNTRLCLNYRDQWPQSSGRFITYAFSLDQYISSYNSGLGVLFLRDNAGGGKLTTTQVGLNYSYRIKLNKDIYIQPGMQALYYQRKINYSKLVFSDQFYGTQILPTTVETQLEDSPGHVDFTSSLLVFSRKTWFGFTVDHMMKLSNTLQTNQQYVPIKVSVYGGIKVPLRQSLLVKEEQTITAAFNYRNQASMQQLDLGLYYSRSPLTIGLWYRGIPISKGTITRDAVTLSAGAAIRSITIIYSYDLTVSSLITSTGGAHEVSLVYLFDNQKSRFHEKRRMGAVPCPKF